MTYLSLCAIKAATSESAFSLLLQHKATIVNGVLLAIGSTVATYISLFITALGRSIWRCLNIILMQRCYWRALLRLWVRCWWGCYVIRLGVKADFNLPCDGASL